MANRNRSRHAGVTNGPRTGRASVDSCIKPHLAPQSRLRFAALVALLAVVIAVLLASIGARQHSRPDRLFLNDDVILSSPPALPESDGRIVQIQFHRLARYRSAALQHPEDAEEQLEFGIAALQVGDPLEAVAALQLARRLSRYQSADLYFNLGHAQNMLGLCGDGLKTYQDMIRAYPLDSRGYLQLSLTLDLLNRPREAAQALDVGIAALPPNDIVGLLSLISQVNADGDTGRALQQAQAVSAHSPGSSQASLAVADLLMKSLHFADARRLVADVLAREPSNPHAHYKMGEILISPLLPEPERDLAAAEHELLTAAGELPGNPTFYGTLAEFYLNRGKYRQCAYTALLLLKVSPDDGVGRLHLSQAMAHLGNSSEASEQSAIASRLIARDRKTNQLQTWLFTHPTSVKTNLELAHHFETYGQFTNAMARVESVCALTHSDPESRLALAELCTRIGIAPQDVPAIPSL